MLLNRKGHLDDPEDDEDDDSEEHTVFVVKVDLTKDELELSKHKTFHVTLENFMYACFFECDRDKLTECEYLGLVTET